MKYCKRCVYPTKAVNINIDDDGICSSCRAFENTEIITNEQWKTREKKFVEIISQIKGDNSKNNYDCLIPVSGGKDSYYQTHVMVDKFGLKPLLMTYHGNNFLPEGDFNRDRMREVFNADHIVWGPSVNTLKKLNRLAFKKMGDMNWHNHCGIKTAPIKLAANFNIPLIIWGEINWDISGMFDPNDFAEFSAKTRHEHDLRGYEWYDFLGDKDDLITEKDMNWAKYPTDMDILKVGIRGLYIGNYFKWDPNLHTEMLKEKYGWKPSNKDFQRTYRKMSNLDDRYENGVHDLLKFVKFGYGRCSDHASKDIRTGYINRNQGIEYVKVYDHVISDDLYHWLEYVEMSENEFWETADKFRDPEIWWIENNEWCKENIWGSYSKYGEVHLNKKDRKKYDR
jgi:N-acetyl sugar amidotransferase